MATKPFTAEYVLAVTRKQLLKSCDKSILNATTRRAEFIEDSTKLAEIDSLLETLNTIKMAVEAVTTGDKQ